MRTKVVVGVISGRTAKEVSPTSPRVTLLIAFASTDSPSFGATITANEFSNANSN